MTPEELLAHLKDVDASFVEREEIAFGQLSIWVPASRWQECGRHLKECGKCRFDLFTFLCGVDLEEQGIEVVCHVYSVRRQHHISMKIVVARDGGRVPTLSGVWRGANWHERETWELFGVEFDGHPHLVKLLLPEAFEGFPMRKDFLLMTREAKDWEGRMEPAETSPGRPGMPAGGGQAGGPA